MPSFATRGSARLLGRETPPDPAPSPLNRRPPLASLGLQFGGMPAAPPAAVKERRTGVAFPGDFCYSATQRVCPVIVGTGARSKRLAGIKNLDIYALGLFVAEGAARRELARFRGATPESLAASQALFDGARGVGARPGAVLCCGQGRSASDSGSRPEDHSGTAQCPTAASTCWFRVPTHCLAQWFD